MKTSLDHLPQKKRDQITAIAAVVRTRAPVEMVILFGSYARGDWVEDLGTGYFSDFDLMAVVETPERANDVALWSDITKEIRPYGGHVPVTLVAHDVRQFNHEIRMGQYFYADVVNEGVLLYDSGRFKLARPKALTPAERRELGLHNFDYWFQSANEFWRGAAYYAARGLGAHAAFSLHQAAERYFHAVLLVFTGYKPKSHDIEALSKQTAPFHAALQGALPRAEPEDKHHFDLLKRAYIDARYSKSYRVTPEELSVLRGQVLDLAGRVRTACAERLGAMLPSEELPMLAAVPDVGESVELPDLPDLDDPKSVQAWRDAVAQMSYERGMKRGLEEGLERGVEKGLEMGLERGREEGLERGRTEGRRDGLEEGLERGRDEGLERGREEGLERGRTEERARAIVEVLRHRGIALTDEQAQRITECRDEVTLTRWWERVWLVSAVEEL